MNAGFNENATITLEDQSQIIPLVSRHDYTLLLHANAKVEIELRRKRDTIQLHRECVKLISPGGIINDVSLEPGVILILTSVFRELR